MDLFLNPLMVCGIAIIYWISVIDEKKSNRWWKYTKNNL